MFVYSIWTSFDILIKKTKLSSDYCKLNFRTGLVELYEYKAFDKFISELVISVEVNCDYET
jgi:hypothetical protein